MANIDLTTGLPVIRSVKTELVGEISDEREYYEIIDWDDGTTTIHDKDDDAIVLTPELMRAIVKRYFASC